MSSFKDRVKDPNELAGERLLAKYGIAEPNCGFNCPPGWMLLVERTFQAMLRAWWSGHLSQVKQKFGGLRLYWHQEWGDDVPNDPIWEAIEAIVTNAEAEAWSICEECSSTENVTTSPLPKPKWTWVRSLCPDCHAKRDLTP